MEQFIKNVLKQEVYSGTKTKALHLLSMGNVLPLFEQFEFDSFLEFEVLSESNAKKFYYVSFSLSDWYDDGPLCSCPQYPIENNCKHVAACLLYLLKPSEIDIPIKKPIETQKTVKETNQTGSNYMDYHEIVKGLNHSQKTDLEYKTGFANPKIIAHHPQDNQVTFSVDKHEVTFTIKDHSFEAKCTCQHKKVTLCLHSRAVLYVNFKTYRNPFFIRTFRDITQEKQVLLKNTGLTPSDETVNDIYDFYFEFDRLQMKPKKNVIFDLTQSDFISKLQGFKKKPSSFHTETIKDLADGHILILKLGAGDKASNFSLDLHPYLGSLQNPKKIKAKISFKSKKDLKNIASEMVDVFFEFTNMGKVNTLRENGRLSPYYRNDNDEIAYNMNPEKWDCVDRNLLSTLEKLLPWLIETNEFFLNKENISKISFENLSALSFSTKRASPHLKLEKQQSFLVVTPQIIIDNETFNVKDFISIRNLFFLQNQEAFLVENFDSKILFDSLIGVDELKIHTSKIHEFVKDFLLPNRQRFSIDIPEDLIPKLVIPNNTKRAIRLKELEPNYLIIEPFMIYDEAQIVLLEEESFVLRDGKTVLLDRNLDQEKEFEILVKNQHPDFESQENNSYFFLPISKVIQNHWFLDFFKTLADNSIEIYGQKELKKLKFNLNRPKISISGSSGIDWFDLKIELTYGDEVVPLKILKSAIVNKQDYITLADGSLGILPEEWIKKFSPMLKLGNTDKGNLRMSKLHFGMIDAADEFIQDKKIQNELAEKKKSLSEIDNTTNIPLPKNIKAKLRPYQLSGFQWFNKLYQLGWGGCLADDMGLGKTLQSLAFIRHVHNQKPEVKSLIVCPTSLIYNWLAESSKFTPDLRTKAYHGTLRELPEVQEYDLLITSYGTFRNDLEKLKDINFEICILDESQAIKNPAANISKAVGEINTRNRFILSGTPLQNNTFDLFSQFNFINPGLLGSRDYFKEEFSTPIDKYADSDKKSAASKDDLSIYAPSHQRPSSQRLTRQNRKYYLLRNG